MKLKEIKELHNKELADLERQLRESEGRLRALRFDLAAGKVKNVSTIRELKRDIARILTVIRLKSKPSR